MGRLNTVSIAPRPGKRPLARRYPSAMPKTATTIVASKAACRETDSGPQTHGGMPSTFSHECGTSPVTLARCSPVPPAQALGHAGRSTTRVPVTRPSL